MVKYGQMSEKTKPDSFPILNHIPPGIDGWLLHDGTFVASLGTEHDASAEFVKQLIMRDLNEADQRTLNMYAPRYGLKRTGIIQVNGTILPIDDPDSLSPQQRQQIDQANLRVVSMVEPNIEVDSPLVSAVLSEITNGVLQSNAFLNAKNFLLTRIGPDNLKQLEDGFPGHPTEYYNAHVYKKFKAIADFAKDPTKNRLEFGEFYQSEPKDGHDIDASELFDIVSFGFSDELVLRDKERSSWVYRRRDVDGTSLITQKYRYAHDGQSAGSNGDYIFYITASLVDDAKFAQSLLYRTRRDQGSVFAINAEILNPNGYFANLLETQS